MKFINLVLIVFLAVSVSFAQKLGKEITTKKVTKISKILENPEKFVGKKVLVEGKVLEVCQMAGCWMDLKSDKKDAKIKVKVKDGEIVFPQEAVGKTALVEGEVYKIEMTQEEAIEWEKHMAEENGKTFDAAAITGPVTRYQIKGLGAVIK